MGPRRTVAAIFSAIGIGAVATVASLFGASDNVTLAPLDNWQAAFDAADPGTVFECRGTHAGVSVIVSTPSLKVVAGDDCVLAGNGASFAFQYAQGGEGFVLSGSMLLTGYQPEQQRGVIHAAGPSSWTVEGVTLERNGGLGARPPGPIGNASYGIRVGDDLRVAGVTMRHNGNLGIGGVGLRLLIVANTIELNNWGDQDTTKGDVEALRASLSGADNTALLRSLAVVNPGNEGGGTKFVRSTGLIEDNYVGYNNGPGLWTDIDNGGVLGGLTIQSNVVEWNASEGIKHEISYAAEIVDNTSRYNGWAFYVWGWGCQLQVQNSSGVRVRGNTLRVGADGRGNGLCSVNQSRGSGAQGPWVSTDAEFTDNLVILEGTRGSSGIFDDTSSKPSAATGAQTWARNTYVGSNVQTGSHWEYVGVRTFADWQSRGFGAGSRLLREVP